MVSLRSALLNAIMYGISFSSKSFINCSSVLPMPSTRSTTSTATSTRLRIKRVFDILFSPSSPSSSKPGVSMMTTGPRGRSSIAFVTGSVVVPLVSDTTARSWFVILFTRLDLPAFLLPKKPMWILSPDGVSLRLMVVLLRLRKIWYLLQV